jgi:hypothetical protein
MAVNALLYGTQRVDPAWQLAPVASVATVPMVWTVIPAFLAQDFPRFLAGRAAGQRHAGSVRAAHFADAGREPENH